MMYAKPQRASYIPKGALKIADKTSPSEAYLKEGKRKDGRTYFWVVAFAAKQQKPAINCTYSDPARARQAIADLFAGVKARNDRKAEWKAEQNVPSKLMVGTILTGSWGYEQTNVEAWQVVELVGERTVKIRRVKTTSVGKDSGVSSMADYVIPCPDDFVGGEDRIETKRVTRGNYVRLTKYCGLSPWDGRKLYSSWYA